MTFLTRSEPLTLRFMREHPLAILGYHRNYGPDHRWDVYYGLLTAMLMMMYLVRISLHWSPVVWIHSLNELAHIVMASSFMPESITGIQLATCAPLFTTVGHWSSQVPEAAGTRGAVHFLRSGYASCQGCELFIFVIKL
ncbi:hypothetical protein Hypma_004427 [Hypsizygus marmoreus]|uniref:Uncharacterized protein n=1 Tax=Hypsizygus marmoreus TaxID=39966 RepID=A0A369JYA9_HYPMA|nr:hypothetical protein Hypma_004427 [Hypsizygus marmoreus]